MRLFEERWSRAWNNHRRIAEEILLTNITTIKYGTKNALEKRLKSNKGQLQWVFEEN